MAQSTSAGRTQSAASAGDEGAGFGWTFADTSRKDSTAEMGMLTAAEAAAWRFARDDVFLPDVAIAFSMPLLNHSRQLWQRLKVCRIEKSGVPVFIGNLGSSGVPLRHAIGSAAVLSRFRVDQA